MSHIPAGSQADTDRYDDESDDNTYAVSVTRQDGNWLVRELPDASFDSLDKTLRALRSQSTDQPIFGLFNIDDDYFVIVRPVPGGVNTLVSDASAFLSDDLVADCLDESGIDLDSLEDEIGDSDDVEPWAEGEWELLADLGYSEESLSILIDSDDLWASEQLACLAADMGFDEELADVTGVDPAGCDH